MNKPIIKTQRLLLVCAMFVCLLCLGGCSDDATQKSIGAAAKLTDFTPESARKGTMLTLGGENLGASRKNVQVWINDISVDVINVTQTKINVRVPEKVGNGAVKVKIGEKEFTYPVPFNYIPDYIVSTFAGTGVEGGDDGALESASFTRITDVAYDPVDDAIFTLETDMNPQRLRRIKGGNIATIAKFNIGAVTLNNPRSIEFSITGDTLFVGNDNGNNVKNVHAVALLKRSEGFAIVHPYISTPQAVSPHVNDAVVNPVDGTLLFFSFVGKVYAWDKEREQAIELDDVLSIIKEGDAAIPGSTGTLCFSPDGRTIYLTLRKPFHGILSATYDIKNKSLIQPFRKFVGSGKAGAKDGYRTEATMSEPIESFCTADGKIYVTEIGNNTVRSITPDGDITLFAGAYAKGTINGIAEQARFYLPRSIIADKDGIFYIGEYRDGAAGSGNRIRMIKPEI